MTAWTTRDPDRPFELVGSNLPAWPDPAVAIAASRAGATGLLNLEHTAHPPAARAALDRLVAFGGGSIGVKLTPGSPVAETLASELPAAVSLVVLTERRDAALGPWIERVRAPGRRVFVECRCAEDAQTAIAGGADGLVAKGGEAGGHVGEETSFVLIQRLSRDSDRPVLAYGGIGLHTAPACYAAGCHGIVLDAQLAAAREAGVPSPLRDALERMEGDETVCLGADLGDLFRVYQRPGMGAVEELRALESSLQGLDAETARRRWHDGLQDRIGWEKPQTQLWPLGQDAALAARLGRRFRSVAGILDGFRAAVAEHIELARGQRALDRGAALARAHGTEYPILQGPMTRVSDTAPFAEAVGRAGALPFLALALLKGPQVRSLLIETRERMGERPWGVGILGFVPQEVRAEQLAVIREVRPRFAIIAGGRPDQAAALEADGISTYLHVPAPGLLSVFLEAGARRFVFEGRECGGHVGPRTSFVLWQAAIDTLLDAVDAGTPAEQLHVVFAGGIHDQRSAAMVAAMAAPLVARGARIGVLLGTAYLYTEEAVAAGAIVAGFQQEALRGHRTVILESGPGHATRCLDTPFFETFRDARRRLIREGRPAEQVRGELEALNLGRLRIASKGIAREPSSEERGASYVTVDPERQRRDGLYMIGQVATLRSDICRIADLHESVSTGGAALLDALPALPRPRARAAREPRPVDVAIIGLGCLLPRAHDAGSFWANVLGKVDAITEVPKQRFDVDRYYDSDRKARDRVYSRWGGFLEDVPFDPLRYGIPPAALPSIDSLQLLSLEVVRQALADAGYLDRDFPRERTAVILGLSGGLGDLGLRYGVRSTLPQLFDGAQPEILDQLPAWTEDSFAGILLNVAAGRVANRFDLGGVNYTVDAACASSLAAVYLAAFELESGTSDMVVVGGVDTVQSPFGFLCFSTSQALSPRGRCRTFDAGADGIAISEGLSTLVLKRLADAERDGDRIYAVIKGVAGSSDGRGKSLTAPRPEGQTLALERAYAQAGISPATVGLIEAHGTGTVVGDAAEVAALGEVFRAAGAAPSSCAIGSVKSMIGHTKSAAGVTGMLKVALALHHKVLPPTLHVETPNPRLQEAGVPFFANPEPLPWIPAGDDAPRRAGVSSFGFGGTNFHAVLEEYRGDYAAPTSRRGSEVWPAELFVWNGSGADALDDELAALQAALDEGARPRLRDLAASVTTAAGGRRPAADALRLAIVAADLPDLHSKLGAAREALRSGAAGPRDSRGVFLGRGSERPGKLAFLFPGQGSQAPYMLRDLALLFPHIGAACERADRLLAGRLPGRLSALIYPPPAFGEAERAARMAAITDTAVAQPALGAVEMGLLHLLRELGLEPDMVAGHSYGEYVALAAAGVLTERELLEISEARGRAIKESVGESPGTMAAVLASADAVSRALAGLPEVWLANLNAPGQTIVSGTHAGVQRAIDTLSAAGLRARPLPVACAFHTPLMEPARERLAGELARLDFRPARVPVFGNTGAAPYPQAPERVAALLSEHLVKPVRFADEVRAMHAHGARLFVEVGPKSVLTGLVRRILHDEPAAQVISLDADRAGLAQLLSGLGQLAAAGVELRLEKLFEGRSVAGLGLERLLEIPKPPGWVVSGAGARPAGSEPKPLAPAKVAPQPAVETPPRPSAPAPPTAPATAPPTAPPSSGAPVGRPVAAAAGAPSADAGAHPADSVMLQFQSLMSQFLQTQAALMTTYLQRGDGEIALPAGEPAAAARTPALAVPPAPELPVTAPAQIAAPVPAQTPAQIAAPVPAQAPALEPPAPAPRVVDVGAALLRVVSERTGYPPDMLASGASLEADLGIDSIKRVEILSAFQQGCTPDQQARVQAEMERLTRLGTLRELADCLTAAIGDGAPDAVTAAPARSAQDSPRDVAAELLRIVSERTGYPVEMLERRADIEADLGIDSIKRVEILSAFQGGCASDEQARVQGCMDRLVSRRTLEELAADLEQALSGDAAFAAGHGAAEGPAAEAAPAVEPVRASSHEAVPRLTLTRVPAPADTTDMRGRPGRVWLLTDDEGGLAESVAVRLEATGERPVLVRHRPGAATTETEPFEVDLTQQDRVAAFVAAVSRRHGSPAGLLHLLPLKAGADFDELSAEAWRTRVQADIKTLYTLLRAAEADLTRAGREGGATVLAATGLGASLRGAGEGGPPSHGGVTAFLKTVAAELPAVTCRAVHLEPARPADERVAQLLAEIASPQGPVEVGYVAGRRLTVVPRHAPLPDGSNGLAIGPDWVFLVTGGARGITAEICAQIAGQFSPTLVLAGLTPLPADEPPETAAVADPGELRAALTAALRASRSQVTPAEVESALRRLLRDREIRRNLDALRASGARVEYHGVDVRDEAAFGALIDDIYRSHGRLDAVIHGAGIIEDKLLKDKTADSFDRVVHTKTDSAFILARHLRPQGLKLLVFMSSITATFGNRGQADYGAANGVLNALAELLAARWPGRVRALNWGPWDKTGMVSDAVKSQFASRGIQVIPALAGAAAAARELQAEGAADAVVVFGGGPWVAEAVRAEPAEVGA